MGTKEATNNFFVAPQPKGFKSGGSGSQSAASLAAQQQAIPRIIAEKVASSSSTIADTAQTVATTLSHGVASVSAAAAQAVTSSSHASHGTAAKVAAHGHAHGSHAQPWEGVNLWRTPYKGDTDTITHVKRSTGTLDQYVENRTRHIQQLQLYALVRIEIRIFHISY